MKLLKIVDVSHGDDSYAEVVTGHKCQPWESEQLERWVVSRYDDPRELVVKPLTPDELWSVLPETLFARGIWIKRKSADEWIENLAASSCHCRGECDEECEETGDCSGSCESDCNCPPEDEQQRNKAISHAQRFILKWMLAGDSRGRAMQKVLLAAMRREGLL